MAYEIREVKRTYSLWGGFRDELVATAMTLSLLVAGSYIVTERWVIKPQSPPEPETVQAETPVPNRTESQTLGVQDGQTEIALPTPASAAAPEASEGAVVFSQIPYGEDGDYDFEGYQISFRDPRLVFDAKTNSKRKLMVNVWIKNKTVAAGVDTRLTASIVKDGKIIVPAAVLYVPRPARLKVNEEISFEASLALIEATDVRELKYKPGDDNVEASHFLYP